MIEPDKDKLAIEVLEKLSELFDFELTERIDLFGFIPIYKSRKIWKRVKK